MSATPVAQAAGGALTGGVRLFRLMHPLISRGVLPREIFVSKDNQWSN